MEENLPKKTIFCCDSSENRLDYLERGLSGKNLILSRMTSLYELLYKCSVNPPSLVTLSADIKGIAVDKVVRDILEMSRSTHVILLVAPIKLEQFHFLSELSSRVSVMVDDIQGHFIERIFDISGTQLNKTIETQPFNNKLLQGFLDNLPETLIILDENLKVFFANQKFLELIGDSKQQYLGKNFILELDETIQVEVRKKLKVCLIKKRSESEMLELLIKKNPQDVLPCRASYSFSQVNKKSYIQICMKDETQILTTQADDKFQNYFENAVMNLSSEIVGVNTKQLPKIIINGLKELSMLLRLDQIQVVSLPHEYIEFQKILSWPRLEKIETKNEFPWLLKEVFQKGRVSVVDTHSLPLDAMEEFDWLRTLKMHALAAIPLGFKEDKSGMLLAIKKDAYKWTAEDFTRLGNVSFLIKNIMSRLLELKYFRKTEKNLEDVSKQLSQAANIDVLTGFVNRTLFEISLFKEIRRSARQRNSLTLMIIEIDYFDQYKSSLGAEAADGCLKLISVCLDEVFQRAGDLISRLSEDKFAIILAGIETTDSIREAERLVNAISDRSINHPDSEISSHITFSIGITTIENSLISMSEFIEQAEKSLTKAKTYESQRLEHYFRE